MVLHQNFPNLCLPKGYFIFVLLSELLDILGVPFLQLLGRREIVLYGPCPVQLILHLPQDSLVVPLGNGGLPVTLGNKVQRLSSELLEYLCILRILGKVILGLLLLDNVCGPSSLVHFEAYAEFGDHLARVGYVSLPVRVLRRGRELPYYQEPGLKVQMSMLLAEMAGQASLAVPYPLAADRAELVVGGSAVRLVDL